MKSIIQFVLEQFLGGCSLGMQVGTFSKKKKK